MIQIDGFDDLRPIGHGGLGDVYRAQRRSTGGTVAIKVLRDVSDSSVAWHRTRRELTALVSLSGHAHVIRLLELLDLPAGPALVMEYAPGGSVADLLAGREDVLTVSEITLIGRQAADALDAAHAQDIVHRDVKPQNLLIDGYGQIKLCDFGIASLTRSEEFRTRTSALSMRYASPEDLDEDAEGGQVGPPSDVYSLGATLLHLAHGAPPTLKERLAPWEPPDVDDADLAALDQIIASCLQPDPAARPTAAELLVELEELDWRLDDRCRALPVIAPTDDVPESAAAPVDLANNAGSDVPDHELDEPGTDDPRRPGRGFGDDTSAATVVRADRPRPTPAAAPAPERRGHRWPWAVAAVAGAALAGITLALIWPDEADAPESLPPATTNPTSTSLDDAANPTTTTAATTAGTPPAVEFVERPADVPELGGDDVTWPFGPVGECLALEPDADTLAAIECDEPHDLQRFDVDSLDPDEFPPDAAFDADPVRASTDEACRAAFVEFVGVDPTDSEFEIAVTRPSADTWATGDRAFQCLLGVPDARLVGDATASAQ
ncbi:MAG: hypothetical protein CL424_01280 [Acidimicrobiaceae bacterium]|nr:hypothetical protein [Acidimicrobiaceae bacterium]